MIYILTIHAPHINKNLEIPHEHCGECILLKTNFESLTFFKLNIIVKNLAIGDIVPIFAGENQQHGRRRPPAEKYHEETQ